MSFLDAFRKKESDPELQRLVELARDSKNAPEPQVELALAYMARIETPPNWNDDYAKKAISAFQKAITIAKKHAPSQMDSIRGRFIEMVYEVADAYGDYYDAQPDLKWLEKAIWLLDQVLPEAEAQSDQAALIRATLCVYWTKITEWHEEKLQDKSEGEDRLKKCAMAAERAMSYADDEDMRALLDYDIARDQLAIGLRYAKRARESAVLNRPDGKLINMNDREHKEYARQAIRILQAGRTRLEQYPASEDYEEVMADANNILAVAYSVLYELTWAHSKMSKSIKILQEGVKAVSDNADLWHLLGKAYDLLRDEVLDKAQKDIERGSGLIDLVGARRNIGVNIGEGMIVGQAKLKIRGLEKKAVECFQKARELAPDEY